MADWAQSYAQEFIDIARDKGVTDAEALIKVSDGLRAMVRWAIDKSKDAHHASAHDAAVKFLADEKAKKDEVDAAMVGQRESEAASKDYVFDPSASPSPAASSGQARTAGGMFASRAPAWVAVAAIAVGDKAKLSGGSVLTATTAGTTGSIEPTVSDVNDGTVVWKVG